MEIITPELVAIQSVAEITNDSDPVAEDIDFGVRFPLATMLNKIELRAGPGQNTFSSAARHGAQLISGLGQTTRRTGDDINSDVIADFRFSVVDVGTAASAIVIHLDERWTFMDLPPEARPITVDGFSAVVQNIDGVTLEALYLYVLRYQIVRLTAEEFASRRAALPSG